MTRFLLCLCVLLFPSIVLAADHDDITNTLDVQLGTSGALGTADTTSVKLIELDASVRIHATPRLSLTFGLHPGLDSIDVQSRVDDTMTSSGTLSGASLRIGAGAAYTLLAQDPFSIDMFANATVSAIKEKLTVNTLRVTTPEGNFNVSHYLAKNAQFALTLNTYVAGVTTRFRLGRFSPRMTIAFDRIDATVDSHLYPDAQDLLAGLGHDPAAADQRHSITAYAVDLSPGLDFRCTDRLTLGLEAGGLALGDHWIFTAALAGTWKFSTTP